MPGNSATPDALPAAGERVSHPALGPGRVVRVERGGRWLWVAFERSPTLPFRVRAGDLARPLSDAVGVGVGVGVGDSRPPAPPAVVPPSAFDRPGEAEGVPSSPGAGEGDRRPAVTTVEVRDDPRHRALVVLEALRLGTVPHGGLRAYTVGREANLEAVLSALDPTPASGGRLRVVVGDYGTGKTHLMECVRQEALARGWAVGAATLDSREATPAHPRRVYSALVRTLTLPATHEPGGLGALFDVLLERGRETSAGLWHGAHRYLDPALHYYSRLSDRPELRDLLLEWLEGQPGERSDELNEHLRRAAPGPRLLALPDYRTFAVAFAYVLGGIACLCREAGGKGLCVLLDEAEFYAALDAEHRAFADNLFGCYSLAALGEGQARRGEESLERGGQEVHRRLPLRHRPDQPLACVFFLTPHPQGLRALDQWVDLSRHAVELSPLKPAHYAELYDRIHRVYAEAHPGFALPRELARPMGDFLHAALATGAIGNPRGVLKLLVEFLDLCRLAPHHLGAVLADLGRLFA
jgi:hypothetical protein